MTRRVIAVLLLLAMAPRPASAQTIIDDWAGVKVPPPPVLKPVASEPATTALLLLDFNGRDEATSGPCNKAT